jgi:hypothetical protein
MSGQLASLGAEQQGDRLQRLERSMLRLERVNIEILGDAAKARSGDGAEANGGTSCHGPNPSPMR